jgi:histidine triad (HIT) family protein
MSECVFCRIVSGDVPAQVVHRRDGFVAFHDIAPKAPVHLIAIPERHVTSLDEVDGLSPEERADMLLFLAETARVAEIAESGYRVTTNHGPDSRQSVFHLHWHVLGGGLLSETM